ncbi:MAG: hypothetical protein NWF07_11695, partial [Candidatus Bathyarchaeota archaeon]|nr:hypothetical protein [Candidatus Bathyarchaeota archaeon]
EVKPVTPEAKTPCEAIICDNNNAKKRILEAFLLFMCVFIWWHCYLDFFRLFVIEMMSTVETGISMQPTSMATFILGVYYMV